MLDETYWAVRDGGSFCHGEPLHASAVDSFADCCFNPNGLQQPQAARHLPLVMDLMQRSWSTRAHGGALDACLVASGKVDIWFEPKVEVWDLAALKIIVEEAGGAFFALDGSRRIDRGNAIACAPGLEAAVRQAFGVP
jgi:fructose-1,6-bisphosphatase/inositol monophosphatase family enzyme